MRVLKILPCYTYTTENLEILMSKTPQKYLDLMTKNDNIALAVAAHWGPGAFGYVFVEKE